MSHSSVDRKLVLLLFHVGISSGNPSDNFWYGHVEFLTKLARTSSRACFEGFELGNLMNLLIAMELAIRPIKTN